MPQQYTVRHNETGRTITFDWHLSEPPTDADMEEVFAAAPAAEPDLSSGSAVGEFLLNRPGPLGQLAQSAASGGMASLAPAVDAGRKVVHGLSRRLYSGLLKQGKNQKKEFPDAVDTLITERAPISRGGAAKVERALSTSSQAADDVIAHANPTTPPIRAKEIIPEMRGTITNLRQRADIGQPSQLPQVGERGRRLLAADAQRGGFDLSRAQELKKTAQKAASAGYRQAERGGVKEVGADTLLDQDVARGFRKAIEQRVPEVAPINQRTQSLVGAQRALDDALSREGNSLALGGMRDLIAAGAGGGLGAAVGAPAEGAMIGLLMRLLATPNVGSRAAILANDAARLGVPTHILRALMASHGTGRTTP
jgi:hypothetical protein